MLSFFSWHFPFVILTISYISPTDVYIHGDWSILNANGNGFLGSVNSFGDQPLSKEEPVSFSAASEPSRPLDPRLEGSKKSMGSVSALKELVNSQELEHL